MENYWARLLSFKHFPDSCPVHQIALAKAGYFYTGTSDRVVCPSCFSSYSGWKHGDSPRDIHRHMSPNCRFLKDSDDNVLVQEETGHRSNTVAGLQIDNVEKCDIKEDEACDYKTFQTVCQRQSSFHEWKYPDIQDPNILAEAGFFYEGPDDRVRCYSCGIGLKKWEIHEDPWIEHAHFQPKCKHLALNKQTINVNANARLKTGGQAQCEQIAGQHTNMRNSEDLGNLSAVGKLTTNTCSEGNTLGLSFGSKEFTKELKTVECKPLYGKQRGCREEPILSQSVQSSRNTIVSLDAQYGRSTRGPCDQHNSLQYYIMSLIHDNQAQEIKELKKESQCLKIQVQKLKQYKTKIKAEKKSLKEERACRICLEKKVEIVMLPCGHVICNECQKKVEKCPICRKPIQRCMKIYFS